jgi:hypothetical protein
VTSKHQDNEEGYAANRRLAQWRVQWLIQHSTSHQLLCCIYSLVLRNPPLRQAPNRCGAIRRHIGSPDCMRRCGLERLTSAHLRDFSAARSFATPAPKPRKSGDPLSVILLATVQPLSRQDTTTINIKRHERNNLPKL